MVEEACGRRNPHRKLSVSRSNVNYRAYSLQQSFPVSHSLFSSELSDLSTNSSEAVLHV